MKIGIAIARSSTPIPFEKLFLDCDQVAVKVPNVTLPDDSRIQKLSDYPLNEDFALFDAWATRLADALRRNDQTLPIREREYFRLAIQDFLQTQLGNSWNSASAFVKNLEPARVRTIVLCVEDPFLRNCLASLTRARGFNCQIEDPKIRGERSAGSSGRARIEKAFSRLVAAAKATVSRASGLRAALKKTQKKILFACVGHPDDYEFFDYTLREMEKRGYQVILVDVRRLKGERTVTSAPYPYLHLWTLPALLGFGIDRTAPPRLARHEVADLPVASGETLAALTSMLDGAAAFYGKCRAANVALWKHLKPTVILTMGEGAELACMAGAAAEHGIAFVDLAHAIQQPKSRTYACDALALFGPENVTSHLRREVPPASCEVVAVGACRYDKIFYRDFPAAAEVAKALDLPINRPVVMFVSQYLWSSDSRIAGLKTRIARWLSEGLPANTTLILKKHPLEDDNLCEKVLGPALGGRFRVARHENIYTLLNLASAVVLMWSNTGLEAILMKKPVIAILGEGSHPLPYMEHGLCRFAQSAEELRNEICLALERGPEVIPDYEKRRLQFISKTLIAHDGRSFIRLADLLERKVCLQRKT